MSRIIFIFLLFVQALLRGPLSLLLIVFRKLLPALGRRIDFERKNLQEEACRSFKDDDLIADYCFEVSSEGELEQVRPLIEVYLQQQKRLEILFSSPSVESKCLKLAEQNRELLRLMRLPLASFAPFSFLFFQSPWQWVSAPKIIFCRYDFFPELLSLRFLGKKLILLSAASKKPSWFKEQAYAFFDIIVAANGSEEAFFKAMFPAKRIFSFDFRVPRIFDRVAKADQTLEQVSILKDYLLFLDSNPGSDKLILGSAWVSDLAIFKNNNWESDLLSGKTHVLLVPHSLSASSILGLKAELRSLLPNVPLYEISSAVLFEAAVLAKEPGIVLLNTGGVLCELYTHFSFAYVGGGYERSIHSVLEPYLSGSQVACGPLVHRSTEYDFVKDLSPDEIHLLKNPESFYNLFKDNYKKNLDQTIRNSLKANSLTQMESIINEIQSC